MKLIIADDHNLFRESLTEYLQRRITGVDLTCVADFFAVEDALEKGEQPDLVILDYCMAGMDQDGIAALKETYPDVKIAVMSGVAEKRQVRSALDSGAVAYFPKTLPAAQMIEGIIAVTQGKVFIPIDGENGEILEAYNAQSPAQAESAPTFLTQSDITLSTREEDMLDGLLKGWSNKEIANHFHVQEVTVKMHLSNICAKLGAKNRTQAALKARELGFKAR